MSKRKGRVRLNIRLEAYDHRILDASALEILGTAERTGSCVCGPVPLPTSVSLYTVLRSPHIDKKSREQFKMSVHKRFLDIYDPTYQTIEALMKIDLSSGVGIEIKLYDKDKGTAV